MPNFLVGGDHLFGSPYFGTRPARALRSHFSALPEDQIFADLVARIDATGAFVTVAWGEPDEVMVPDADGLPCCVVVPVAWDEDDRYSDGTICTVRYQATVVVRDSDPTERSAVARRLAAVVANAGTDVSLAGMTFPAMTRLARGRQGKPRHPEKRIVLDGTFDYLIEPGKRSRGES